ncbi:RNA-binding protein 45-like [Manduca sexta]|uniref:RNA-binding protein 45-like n=1 Tax=Manduca sexta TaxID=7130 RepID=UPI00188E35C0|nr:RNA-binding protein 45-like [Manduca sexta]
MLRKGRGEDSDDFPIYSRLFVICGKNVKEDDLQKAFAQFGSIEDIRVARDYETGASKGVAYIKFSKTSEAANALEEMNNKTISSADHHLVVKVACSRTEIQVDDEDDKYTRLFITLPPYGNADTVQASFQRYGTIVSIQVQKDRQTGLNRGFAYVTFQKFSEAARAYENCDRMYRAIFAMPKNVKRPETAFVSNVQSLAEFTNSSTSLLSVMNVRPGPYTKVKYKCCPHIPSPNVKMLFDLVPGLVNFHHHVDLIKNFGTGFAVYSNPICAAYAVKKLNLFEYPPGINLTVRPDFYHCDVKDLKSMDVSQVVNNLQNAIESAKTSTPDLAHLAQTVAEASKLIKLATSGIPNVPNSNVINYCSVQLPPQKPLADINARTVKRCFLVCKPQPPPLIVLRDIFCRFGDLINVYTLPNKTIGYACYASADAADKAITALHGAEVCGIRIKVIEAEEEAPPKRARYDQRCY